MNESSMSQALLEILEKVFVSHHVAIKVHGVFMVSLRLQKQPGGHSPQQKCLTLLLHSLLQTEVSSTKLALAIALAVQLEVAQKCHEYQGSGTLLADTNVLEGSV